MQNLINIECCKCNQLFRDNEKSWHFYNDGGNHICPHCNSKVVAYYDFQTLGLLDRWSLIFFVAALGLLLVDFYIEYEAFLIAAGYYMFFTFAAIAAVAYQVIIAKIKTDPLMTNLIE